MNIPSSTHTHTRRMQEYQTSILEHFLLLTTRAACTAFDPLGHFTTALRVYRSFVMVGPLWFLPLRQGNKENRKFLVPHLHRLETFFFFDCASHWARPCTCKSGEVFWGFATSNLFLAYKNKMPAMFWKLRYLSFAIQWPLVSLHIEDAAHHCAAC